MVHWKWQEYCYGYGLNGPCGGRDERGSHVLEYRYSGSGSMLWTDLFDVGENAGLYLTCRNDGLRLKAIRCETFGEERPGMGVAIVHFPCLQGGARWEGEPCVLALHEGRLALGRGRLPRVAHGPSAGHTAPPPAGVVRKERGPGGALRF